MCGGGLCAGGEGMEIRGVVEICAGAEGRAGTGGGCVEGFGKGERGETEERGGEGEGEGHVCGGWGRCGCDRG